ncbi:MAG: hypothetical protein C4584_00950 [Armatimonadetes bacterium]|nr:MAG: hypothetical protein C4584_00950 [Armatimonadota bacterium]
MDEFMVTFATHPGYQSFEQWIYQFWPVGYIPRIYFYWAETIIICLVLLGVLYLWIKDLYTWLHKKYLHLQKKYHKFISKKREIIKDNH